MPTVSREFTVTAPPQRVLDYLKDFSNAEQWDPGTKTCTRVDSGPVGVGSKWHNVSEIFGLTTELDYELKSVSDSTLVFEGNNKSATSTDTMEVTGSESGSTITYRADLQMHGPAVLISPAMKLVFEKLAGDTKQQMTRVLNNLAQ
jgi:carbon monoxide dehydrogenase subunit G